MAEASNVLGRTPRYLLYIPDDRFLPRRVLQYRGRRLRGPHRLRSNDRRIPGLYQGPGVNDLSTPVPAFQFPGLKPGDRWCLCASRWKEALDAGVAPPVVLESTHASALEYISLKELKQYAVATE